MEPVALVQVLSASIAPCVLISAFGLLLLSLTNRLGRSVDRIRRLCREAPGAQPGERGEIERQVRVLYRRCRLMRSSVGLCLLGVFGIGMLVLLLFAEAVAGVRLVFVPEALFIASMVFLLGSLVFFFLEVRLTLEALRAEVRHRIGQDPGE
ncbi:MAG: DUF2721 domain-containing protein [Thermodesulfobacteriota bacterium]